MINYCFLNRRQVLLVTVEVHNQRSECLKDLVVVEPKGLKIRHFNYFFILLITFDIVRQATSQGFPHLEELSVAGVVEGISSQPFIDDEALQRIIKSSKKLRLLDVRGCNKVSDSSLVRIPAWDLEHIFLSGKAFSF